MPGALTFVLAYRPTERRTQSTQLSAFSPELRPRARGFGRPEGAGRALLYRPLGPGTTQVTPRAARKATARQGAEPPRAAVHGCFSGTRHELAW